MKKDHTHLKKFVKSRVRDNTIAGFIYGAYSMIVVIIFAAVFCPKQNKLQFKFDNMNFEFDAKSGVIIPNMLIDRKFKDEGDKYVGYPITDTLKITPVK